MGNEIRLIDANALKRNLNAVLKPGICPEVELSTLAVVEMEIERVPTADAVLVVRCRECKHRYSSEFCKSRPEDAFCSNGEARKAYGYWKEDPHACGFGMQGYLCSECFECSLEWQDECPRCHAKMRRDGDGLSVKEEDHA